MNIDNINLNHLRIFESVFRTRSMTTAAQELHLTQSGVSQHMATLEESIGVKLFDRVKQRLVPTTAAATLFKSCAESLGRIEQTLSEVKGVERQLSGPVNIGMPIEFGNNILLPLLSEFAKKHPRVRFGFRYGFATEMNDALLGGTLDFAFVDAFTLDKQIRVEKVFDETLYLCASPELMRGKVKETREFFESLPYVDYQTGEPILRMWFKHHFKERNPKLNVRATVMDVQGVARLIMSGLAAGVLPGYLVEKLEAAGNRFVVFKGCGKPLKNAISVAALTERTQSPAVDAARESILKSLRQGKLIE